MNVIPIDQGKLGSIGDFPIFSKLIFTGSLERSILYSKLSAEAHIPCDTLIPKRPVVIVYEKTDLHSAADGVLEAFFSHDTRVFIFVALLVNFLNSCLRLLLIFSRILFEYLLTIRKD